MRSKAILVSGTLVVAAVAWVLVFALPSRTMNASGGDSRCVKAMMLDWAKDGRIDRTYPATCYYEAIDSLPEDLRAYSSAEDDLRRALQSSARRNP
jgi:hypothetical protein